MARSLDVSTAPSLRNRSTSARSDYIAPSSVGVPGPDARPLHEMHFRVPACTERADRGLQSKTLGRAQPGVGKTRVLEGSDVVR